MKNVNTKIIALSAIVLLAAGGLYSETIANPATPDANQATVTTPAAVTLASGNFEGRSDHVTRGSVRLVQTPTGYAVILSDDFYLDGAPDPVLGFGRSGEYVASSQFTDLKQKRGSQTYALPAGIMPAEFNEIYVWCEKFSVPLGVATLVKS